MFLGTYQPRLDEKGRVILPARFRDELAAGLVITKGQERCLSVWPAKEFAALTEAMGQAPVTAKSARDYMRVMFAGAHDEIPDKQGRVTIPPSLRTYATKSASLLAQTLALRFGMQPLGSPTSQIAKRALQMYLRRYSQDFSNSKFRSLPRLAIAHRRPFPGADQSVRRRCPKFRAKESREF